MLLVERLYKRTVDNTDVIYKTVNVVTDNQG